MYNVFGMLGGILINKILCFLLKKLDYININSFIYIYEELCDFEKNNIYNLKKTLDLVYENDLSLVRFGDGEINHCLYAYISSEWQEGSADLSEELSSILLYDDAKIITCIPGVNAYNRWWKRYWINNWFPFKQKVNFKLNYGNSFITRPEFFLAYKDQGVDLWMRIWAAKDVVFITGKGSRFQFNHDLFSNINSYEIVYSKNKNAFSDLDRLLILLNNKNNKEKIFLIALGQAGTILAYHLHKLGYRSLDIGHIDRSYDYVFKNGKYPEKIGYK